MPPNGDTVWRGGAIEMRIRIMSDLHLEFSDFVPSKVETDVVVLAGDIWTGDLGIAWARRVFPKERIIYVLGNHEAYGAELAATIEKCRSAAAHHRVDFLEDAATVIGDVRFIGATLWSDFSVADNDAKRWAAMRAAEASINDFRMIWTRDSRRRRRRLRPMDMAAHHQVSRQFIETELNSGFHGLTVVVTHFLPAPASISERFHGSPLNAYFCNDLTSIVERTRPTLWVHGHTHESCDFRLYSTRILCNPRGYVPDEPNENFAPELVVEL